MLASVLDRLLVMGMDCLMEMELDLLVMELEYVTHTSIFEIAATTSGKMTKSVSLGNPLSMIDNNNNDMNGDNIENYDNSEQSPQHIQMVSIPIAAHKNNDNTNITAHNKTENDDHNEGSYTDDKSNSDDLFELQDERTTKGEHESDSEMLFVNDEKMVKTPHANNDDEAMDIDDRSDSEDLFESQGAAATKGGDVNNKSTVKAMTSGETKGIFTENGAV